MYNYDFLKDKEHAINEKEQVLVCFGNKKLLVNIMLTDKNLLFFYDTEKDSSLKSSRMGVVSQYEVLLKLSLDNLDYHIMDNFTEINFKGDVILIYNFNLDDFIKL
mgnify:FL=1